MKNKYCYSCGQKVEVFDYIYAYDEDSGDPLTTEIRRCPNNRWFWSHPVTAADAYADHAE